jgi:6-pyruvoyltetrahydropterin/6-carboxytetrahydropterin synthase
LAMWVWRNLKPDLPRLHSVEVRETCTCGSVYGG